MNKNILKILSLITLNLLINKNIYANENQENLNKHQENANKIIEIWRKIEKPKTDFEKWQSDIWKFSAVSCAVNANVKVPDDLNKKGNYRSGSFGLFDDYLKACESLAKGFTKPNCYQIMVFDSPFSSPIQGMPNNYLYLEKDNKKLIKNGDVINISGYCNLIPNSIETKQSFSVPAKVKWLQEPNLKKINTPTGSNNFEVGTINFEIDGYGETEPKMVIMK